jgi:site-specific DNA-methyltransferase (adenine-specific)
MLREQIGDVEILRGDCLEWMAVLKEEGVKVDAVITDPPYGIDVNENNPFSYASTGAKKENPVEWDSSIPLDWIEPALSILYDGGNLLAFTDTRQVSDLWRYLEKVAKAQRLFYCLKSTIMPQPHPRWASCVEVAAYARKHGKTRFWGGSGASPNYWSGPRAMGCDRTEHPTQKNSDLMRKLIRDLCPEGGTVLDPFGGSGTTAVAALLEGRKCITIERDEKYFEIMRKRISSWYDSDEVRQMELI